MQGEKVMALWRKESETLTAKRRPYWRKKLTEEPELIQHGGFFVSDGGGENGIRIDYVERRQMAQRKRPKKED